MTIQHQDEYDKPWKPQPLHTPTVHYGENPAEPPEELRPDPPPPPPLPPSLASTTILRLEPGDVIVVRSMKRLTRTVKAEWETDLKRAMPGHKTVILDGEGIDLQVIRPSQATEAT